MYRARFESLENRHLMAAASLAQPVPPAVVGDFNGDGRDDIAAFTVDSRPELATLAGRLSDDVLPGGSNLIIVVCARGPYLEQDNVYQARHTTLDAICAQDGTSNTLMFGETSAFVAAVYRDVLGRPIEPVGTTNGIIAVLIGVAAPAGVPTGTVTFAVAVDPRDANVVYAFGDGSVRHVSKPASLLASDEFFSRFN
jgi:hypothetical protein